MTALTDALALRADGRLDDAALGRIARTHALLHDNEKVAAFPGAAVTAIGTHVLDILGKSVATTAPLLLAALAVPAVGAGGRALMDTATRSRDLQRIIAVYPRIKEWPQSEIDLCYNSLRSMNPEIARDPLAGGTLLQQMLRNRDPMDPKVPQANPELMMNLMRTRAKDEHLFQNAAQEAVMKGIGHALDERAQGMQQSFMQLQNEGKEQFTERMGRIQADRDEQSAGADRRWRSDEARSARAAQNMYATGAERLKAHLKDRSMAGQRTWEEGEKTKDRAAQDERTVMQAVLGKADPDQMYHEVYDQYGQPTGPTHSAPPQIGHVVGKFYKNHPYLNP